MNAVLREMWLDLRDWNRPEMRSVRRRARAVAAGKRVCAALGRNA